MAKTATFHVEAITIPDHDDRIHISGAGFSAPNTLCGITDDGNPQQSEDVPNCKGCIEVYESVKKHKPRFNFEVNSTSEKASFKRKTKLTDVLKYNVN